VSINEGYQGYRTDVGSHYCGVSFFIFADVQLTFDPP
jgi:hypothetical protein